MSWPITELFCPARSGHAPTSSARCARVALSCGSHGERAIQSGIEVWCKHDSVDAWQERIMANGDAVAGAWADRLGALYTPVIADVLDRLGYRDQSFRAEIRPLFPGARAAGVARTV